MLCYFNLHRIRLKLLEGVAKVVYRKQADSGGHSEQVLEMRQKMFILYNNFVGHVTLL